jgi:hypothetical protein
MPAGARGRHKKKARRTLFQTQPTRSGWAMALGHSFANERLDEITGVNLSCLHWNVSGSKETLVLVERRRKSLPITVRTVLKLEVKMRKE